MERESSDSSIQQWMGMGKGEAKAEIIQMRAICTYIQCMYITKYGYGLQKNAN
jgi:Tfp pilus assembly protein PilP